MTLPLPINGVHTLFDLLALSVAAASGYGVYRWRFVAAYAQTSQRAGKHYLLALLIGSSFGAHLFGTWNLILSDIPGVGRSILGALVGAILTVELYKLMRGVRGSTGYIYALPFCVVVALGRLGCFLSGLDDHTHGLPTDLPWGWDYGDGTPRHPVQLYESAAMAATALFLLWRLWRAPEWVIHYGFYGVVGIYGAQRFVWEFHKPYGPLAGGLNLFHWLCLGLMAYSLWMVWRQAKNTVREDERY
ncbi:prolipoprotein diacylglyceryl transferase [Magnetofaba australis]|uniref:Putative prolipoprotein diacylglyceryl transferase n=1 Tax=Magnetofaba australis IT-1 TaxID=1434232 RepID=A0A1Y2K5E6_9PROT|nr:prolipoprotein diacylglyceryl transferase family protein [Magnetofaba australis]OSM04203.1 putative prolipoprotein diacylglyceryl transferase [Magnetofaba australis IT-1]